MRHVIACVAKYTSTVGSQRRVPVPPNNGVCELPEWGCQGYKERRRHYKSVLVHWKIVVDAVEEEVEGQGDTVIREVASWY